MTIKERAKGVIEFTYPLFPGGNLRYYIMYFSSLFVLGVASVTISVMMTMLDSGLTISTGTFVAHMDFETSRRIGQVAIRTILDLLELFKVLWLSLLIHTGLSAIFDIGRGIVWVWRKLKGTESINKI